MMAGQEYEQLQNSLVSIASELFRFQRVFEKAVSKLEIDERSKYMSQYAWFSKKVYKALDEAMRTKKHSPPREYMEPLKKPRISCRVCHLILEQW